jgi:hypothetical protein
VQLCFICIVHGLLSLLALVFSTVLLSKGKISREAYATVGISRL